MSTITIPAQEATEAVELTYDEAYALANKKIDFWRNFRRSVDRIREEQTAYAVLAVDPTLTKEEQETVAAAAAILQTKSDRAREVEDFLKPESNPKPDDVKPKPVVEEPVEEVLPVEGGVIRG
jgi:hypothetical protein